MRVSFRPGGPAAPRYLQAGHGQAGAPLASHVQVRGRAAAAAKGRGPTGGPHAGAEWDIKAAPADAPVEDVKLIRSVTIPKGGGLASRYEFNKEGKMELHSTIKSDITEPKTEYYED